MQTQSRSPTNQVRLPPVTVREDFLEPQGFNPGRRVSITEPALHAYGQAQHEQPSSFNRRHQVEQQLNPNEPVKQESATPEPPHSHDGASSGSGRYGPAPSTSGPALNYEFGSSFGQTGHHSFPAPLPPPNYKFGGPSTSSHQAEGPSFFDYSMRRHSLTNSQPPPQQQPPPLPSPQRLPSIDSGSQLSSPGSHLKRKTSGEETIMEHSAYYGPGAGYQSQQGGGGPVPGGLSQPYPKRRGSSLTYDKMGTLSLSEQHRRDSHMSGGGGAIQGGGGWEEDRRGSGASGGSYNTNGSSAYNMAGYSMAHHPHQQQHPVEQYDHRGSPLSAGSYGPPSQMAHRPQHPDQPVYEQQVSHSRQSSLNMGPPVHPNAMSEDGYSRYPPNQMGGQYSPGTGPMITHSPPENGHPGDGQQQHPGAPPHRNSSGSYSSLPPAQAAWARAGPLPSSIASGHPPRGVNGRPSGPPRQGSGSSLDPQSAYGPGGMKETPYSRSPELRVSHKLAERKRRKEMAQLFDDLRDALPVNRGLKASKWEILSKAVDFIVGLKEHNAALAADNGMLRQHFGLGPGPQAPPGLDGDGPTAHDQQHGDQGDEHQGSNGAHGQQQGGEQHWNAEQPKDGRRPSPGGSARGASGELEGGRGEDDEDEDELEA